MAGFSAMVTRRAQANDRLTEAGKRLAERFGVEPPNIKTTNRDPELARIQETEQMADFLESIPFPTVEKQQAKKAAADK